VAGRIDEDLLPGMIGDPDCDVRIAVTKRLPGQQLVLLRHDPDWRVRYEVARRIAIEHLAEMTRDAEAMVQEMALMRLMENSMNASEQVSNGENKPG
jgi:hypothetical protein